MWTCVHFLGVWDTVAALGVPWTCLDRVVEPWSEAVGEDVSVGRAA